MHGKCVSISSEESFCNWHQDGRFFGSCGFQGDMSMDQAWSVHAELEFLRAAACDVFLSPEQFLQCSSNYAPAIGRAIAFEVSLVCNNV